MNATERLPNALAKALEHSISSIPALCADGRSAMSQNRGGCSLIRFRVDARAIMIDRRTFGGLKRCLFETLSTGRRAGSHTAGTGQLSRFI